jgi:hypothetical protein
VSAGLVRVAEGGVDAGLHGVEQHADRWCYTFVAFTEPDHV